MKLSELGEFALIERLRDLVAQRQPLAAFRPHRTGGEVLQLLLGIGDDCAVWRAGNLVHLSTTDTMVQGVHFTLENSSWKDLGWKALAVNLSDIAAMGGVPGYALITLGLPETTPVEGVTELYHGLLDCASAYETLVAGGDVVRSPVTFINVAVHGLSSGVVPYPNNVLLRSAAVPDDSIAVTGHLGSAAAGLILLKTGRVAPTLAFALEAHRRPTPRLSTGQLALEAGARCGMDISDGLVGDLTKLCAASGAAAEVRLNRLPVRHELQEAFPHDWPQLALTGGEDYELLLTGPVEVLQAIQERSDLPLTIIGRITRGSAGQVTVLDEQDKVLDLAQGGWDHFTGG